MGSWKGPRGGDKPSGPALFTPPPQARARARGVEPPSRPGSRLRGLRGCWGSRPAWLLGLPNVFSLGLVGPSCGASPAPSSGPRCLSRGKAGGSTPQVPEARWRGSASVLPAALPKQPPWPQGHLRGWHCPPSPPSCLQLPPLLLAWPRAFHPSLWQLAGPLVGRSCGPGGPGAQALPSSQEGPYAFLGAL